MPARTSAQRSASGNGSSSERDKFIPPKLATSEITMVPLPPWSKR